MQELDTQDSGELGVLSLPKCAKTHAISSDAVLGNWQQQKHQPFGPIAGALPAKIEVGDHGINVPGNGLGERDAVDLIIEAAQVG